MGELSRERGSSHLDVVVHVVYDARVGQCSETQRGTGVGPGTRDRPVIEGMG